MRAHRAILTAYADAAAVATGLIFQLEQHEIMLPTLAQRACGSKACYTAAGDHDTGAAGAADRQLGVMPIAQRMTAFQVDAFKATGDVVQRVFGRTAGQRGYPCQFGQPGQQAPAR